MSGLFIIYAFSISKKERIWKCLLVTGVSAVLGELISSFFWAKKSQSPKENWAALELVNEINWILLQSSTVVYAAMKLSVCLSTKVRKAVWLILTAIFLVFVGLRLNIGRLRFQQNSDWNEDIERAHSYAFIAWGAADLVILALVGVGTYDQITRASKDTKLVISVLLKSSIPRFLIISLNTLANVILGQLYNRSDNLEGFNRICWLINASYPFILLFDMLTTKGMLSEAVSMTESYYSKSSENDSLSKPVISMPTSTTHQPFSLV